MALQDLKARLENKDPTESRTLPLSEKVERVRLLKSRLPGLVITPSEPSHSLIDRAVQQFEENSLSYIDLGKATSRQQEVNAVKQRTSISFDAAGNIKLNRKEKDLECSVTGEMDLRAAFTRRALAYDLASVCTFQVMDLWTQTLFETWREAPPAGYCFVSMDQILAADRHLWQKVAEDTRSTSQVCGRLHREVWSVHPQVQFRFMPLPLAASSSSRSTPYPPPPAPLGNPNAKGPGKGKTARAASETPKASEQYKGKIQIPENCEIHFNENDKQKPICMKFNVGACRVKVARGKRCQFGFHKCWVKGCHGDPVRQPDLAWLLRARRTMERLIRHSS